ncbi:MAG: DUF4912 domain-containing protein [bacterium]
MYMFDQQYKPETIVEPPPEELPDGYGEDRLTLMVRDPYWAFAYWEVSGEKKSSLRKVLGDQFDASRLLLRIFITGKNKEDLPRLHMEVDVTGPAASWHLHLGRPDSCFTGQIGFLTPNGEFHAVALSNTIRTPRDTFADEVDSEWMVIEETYHRIFKMVGEVGSSPHILEDLRRSIARRLEEEHVGGSEFSNGVHPS